MKIFVQILLVTLSLPSIGQELVLPDFSLRLVPDSTQSTKDYVMFVRKKTMENITVSFDSIPEVSYEFVDSYGRKGKSIFNQSQYQFDYLDTVYGFEDLSLVLNLEDGTVINNLQFAYQVLSKEKRLIHSLSPFMSSADVGDFFRELCVGMKKPAIIIYAITFVSKGGTTYTHSIGKTCFIIESDNG